MSGEMTARRLEEIEARNAARTQQEWRLGDESVRGWRIEAGDTGWEVAHANPACHSDGYEEGPNYSRANGEFIANAPADITDLLAYVRLLEGLANDRALDSDLAQWARRQEREGIAKAMGVEAGVLDVSLAVIKSRVTIAPVTSVSTKTTEAVAS